MSEVLNDNCFDICDKQTELPFLSVQEGLCFRNCISKFSVFYPTLGRNLEHADFRFYNDKYMEEAQKKYSGLKQLASDPWEKEKNKIYEEIAAKKQHNFAIWENNQPSPFTGSLSII